jgi:hypothetical protein
LYRFDNVGFFMGLLENLAKAIEIVGTSGITAIGGAGVALLGLAAWLGKVWSDRIAQSERLRGEIDLDLRKRRIDAYAIIWKATDILPAWPKDPNVTYGHLQEFSAELKNWYFKTGGIFLSYNAHHKGYIPLQEALEKLDAKEKKTSLIDDDYKTIRKKCSMLRTLLTQDIQSRR